MKHLMPLIAAGLALAAFTPPATAHPADAQETGLIQLAKKSSRRNGPPGWSKGNKNGWNGKPMPPGQWKKYKQQQQQRHRWDRNDRDRYDRYRRDRNDRYDRYDRYDRDHRRTSDRWDGRRYRS